MFELAKENSGFTNFVYAYDLSEIQAYDEAEMESLCALCAITGINFITITDISKSFISIAHSYGLFVMVYTYNDSLKISELKDKGVDYIFTDFAMIL